MNTMSSSRTTVLQILFDTAYLRIFELAYLLYKPSKNAIQRSHVIFRKCISETGQTFENPPFLFCQTVNILLRLRMPWFSSNKNNHIIYPLDNAYNNYYNTVATSNTPLEFVLKCNFIQKIFSGMDINDLTLGSAKLYSTTSKTYTSFKLHIQSEINQFLLLHLILFIKKLSS